MDVHWALKIADFMIQALDLPVDRTELATEIVPLKREAATGISAVELQSSVGPTPFLVYHYDTTQGSDRLQLDLATLEKAAQLDSPGPRIVAHAEAGANAFILATTPSIQRALTGAAAVQPPRSAYQIERARSRVPDRLTDKLREANKLAGDWLAAIDAAQIQGGGTVDLTEEEAALALFLLDEGSIRELLRALSVLLGTARQSAESVM